MVTILPVAAACIAAAFALQLGRQFLRRRRPHALAWAVSLALFAVASATVGIGVSAGWSPWVFGLYWIGGALLNVPWLAIGQLHLLDPGRAVLWWTLAGLVTLWAVYLTLTASFDAAGLAAASAGQTIPLGKEILGGTPAYALVGPLNATFLVVVLGSIWSAVRSRRWRVLYIALGVTVAAFASSAVRVGHGETFSVLLVTAVAIMYGGFVAASKPPRRKAKVSAEVPAGA